MRIENQTVWISAIFQALVIAWAATGERRDLLLTLLVLGRLNIISFGVLAAESEGRTGIRTLFYLLMLLGPWGALLLLLMV